MSFSLERALAQANANLSQRRSVTRNTYVLYYAHNTDRYAGKMVGSTIKELINQFKAEGGSYRYAFITPQNDPDKYLRFYDRGRSNKFFSLTRTGVKRGKK